MLATLLLHTTCPRHDFSARIPLTISKDLLMKRLISHFGFSLQGGGYNVLKKNSTKIHGLRPLWLDKQM
jgi:hypothetical protein